MINIKYRRFFNSGTDFSNDSEFFLNKTLGIIDIFVLVKQSGKMEMPKTLNITEVIFYYLFGLERSFNTSLMLKKRICKQTLKINILTRFLADSFKPKIVPVFCVKARGSPYLLRIAKC